MNLLMLLCLPLACHGGSELRPAIDRRLLPKFSDRTYWQQVAPEYRQGLLEAADRLVREPVRELSFHDYLKTGIDGDRASYENACFARRDNLLVLAAACCVSGDTAAYIPKLIDYLGAIVSEPYWCVYAHADRLPDDVMVTPLTAEKVDLFSAATAADIALVIQVLGDEIAEVSPGFLEWVRVNTLRRTVDSVLRPERDMMHWFIRIEDEFCNNWTPWCGMNLLIAALCLEPDDSRVRALAVRLHPKNRRYFDRLPPDGFNEEGVGYWSVSCGTLLYYLLCLERVLPEEAANILQDPKFLAAGEYICKMLVTPEYFASYADSGSRGGASPWLLRRYGEAAGSARLVNFADYRAARQKRPALTGMAMPLAFFERLRERPSGSGKLEMKPLDFFADRFAVVRNPAGFSATLKAGNNGESHNHNDLGHFTVYYGGTPVIIDAGSMRYGLKNFSEQRYELWYTGAQGHNAPVINGVLQREGAGFRAGLRLLEPEGAGVRLRVDLREAYPTEAGISSLRRDMVIAPESVVVKDRLEIAGPVSVAVRLYSMLPVKVRAGQVRFGDLVELELAGLEPGETGVEHVDIQMANSYAEKIYWIELRGRRNYYSMRFVPVKNE